MYTSVTVPGKDIPDCLLTSTNVLTQQLRTLWIYIKSMNTMELPIKDQSFIVLLGRHYSVEDPRKVSL